MASIVIWNNPRPNKRLLVLDIDHTLAEYKVSEPVIQKRVSIRNHLGNFLTTVYKYYDIAVWSATPMQYIVEKLTVLDMLSNEGFKLLFALDETYLLTASTTANGSIKVKALSVIWEKFEQFDEKNTIMVDDQELNFYLNPKNGLKVTPYHKEDHITDMELLRLSKYLKFLAKISTDFSQEDLLNWKSYV